LAGAELAAPVAFVPGAVATPLAGRFDAAVDPVAIGVTVGFSPARLEPPQPARAIEAAPTNATASMDRDVSRIRRGYGVTFTHNGGHDL
jgi:hypothetical protein